MYEFSYVPNTLKNDDSFRCFGFNASKVGNSIVPAFSEEYRVANVVVSKSMPVIRLRLLSDDSVFYELMYTYTYLSDGYIYCTLVGNSKYIESQMFLGDFMFSEDSINDSYENVLKLSTSNILGMDISLVDSEKIIKSYFTHSPNGDSGKLFEILSSSFIKGGYE